MRVRSSVRDRSTVEKDKVRLKVRLKVRRCGMIFSFNYLILLSTPTATRVYNSLSLTVAVYATFLAANYPSAFETTLSRARDRTTETVTQT